MKFEHGVFDFHGTRWPEAVIAVPRRSGLWTDLVRHLRLRHGRKRLIWARLRAESCPLE